MLYEPLWSLLHTGVVFFNAQVGHPIFIAFTIPLFQAPRGSYERYCTANGFVLWWSCFVLLNPEADIYFFRHEERHPNPLILGSFNNSDKTVMASSYAHAVAPS